ncbi:sugar ABC transporter [Pectobacteriaceae bacterium CE70]|nr:sugar ABC transporter [Pectobacteriaceae bacterium CE70]WJY11726.1 sugar ABC transporter [Pectobacteriaceae bacterium C80]
MFYTVECTYTDPDSETGWNEFYSSEKLPALVSVTGFSTSQRFRAITDGCPVYLAIHTVRDPGVLDSEEYRQKGGGNFSRWQRHISDWHRNLYDGVKAAPAVAENEIMVLSLSPVDFLECEIGGMPLELRAVGLEKSPAQRWLYVLSQKDSGLISGSSAGIYRYEPMTKQLKNGSASPIE